MAKKNHVQKKIKFSMALLWKDIYESDIFEGIPGYLAMIMSAGDIFLFQFITTFVPQ